MERKLTYETPETDVLEIKSEGFVCDSGEVPNMSHGWDLDFDE